jgi:XTP/dITP diphosphohydrolase
MELIFASNNRHKLEEISKIVGNAFTILNLKQANCEGEIPETGTTLEENALQKAHWVYSRTHKNCLADDTGLEIDALNGAPGVYTARFAGDDCSPEDNIQKTLRLMKEKTNRRACFRTVIACIIDGKEYLFEGMVEGEIATEKMGDGGFGYDPIFIPKGFSQSFAQMPLDQKNSMSHRGRATAKFVEFLKNL